MPQLYPYLQEVLRTEQPVILSEQRLYHVTTDKPNGQHMRFGDVYAVHDGPKLDDLLELYDEYNTDVLAKLLRKKMSEAKKRNAFLETIAADKVLLFVLQQVLPLADQSLYAIMQRSHVSADEPPQKKRLERLVDTLPIVPNEFQAYLRRAAQNMLPCLIHSDTVFNLTRTTLPARKNKVAYIENQLYDITESIETLETLDDLFSTYLLDKLAAATTQQTQLTFPQPLAVLTEIARNKQYINRNRMGFSIPAADELILFVWTPEYALRIGEQNITHPPVQIGFHLYTKNQKIGIGDPQVYNCCAHPGVPSSCLTAPPASLCTGGETYIKSVSPNEQGARILLAQLLKAQRQICNGYNGQTNVYHLGTGQSSDVYVQHVRELRETNRWVQSAAMNYVTPASGVDCYV